MQGLIHEQIGRSQMKVASLFRLAENVKRIRLVAGSDVPLQPFRAGDFIEIHGVGERLGPRTALSLTGDPACFGTYEVIVRRSPGHPDGLASCLHERANRGTHVYASGPQRGLSLAHGAARHVFIAGGMGVTPFMSHLASLADRGEPYELHFVFRRFAEIQGICWLLERYRNGGSMNFYCTVAGERPNLSAILSGWVPGTHFYVSGPRTLFAAAAKTATTVGLPAAVIHGDRGVAAGQCGSEVRIPSSGEAASAPAAVTLNT